MCYLFIFRLQTYIICPVSDKSEDFKCSHQTPLDDHTELHTGFHPDYGCVVVDMSLTVSSSSVRASLSCTISLRAFSRLRRLDPRSFFSGCRGPAFSDISARRIKHNITKVNIMMLIVHLISLPVKKNERYFYMVVNIKNKQPSSALPVYFQTTFNTYCCSL